MAQLLFEPSADQALTALHDAGHPDLWDRVNDALDALEDDPGHRTNRRRQFRRPGGVAWGIEVRTPHDDWLILWHDNGSGPVVTYIGPDLPTPPTFTR